VVAHPSRWIMASKLQGTWYMSFETPRRGFPRGLHFGNIDMKVAEGSRV
jgi:hypothetical protein